MPKINVYVPDELAEAVKEAGIPVSAVCQRALETAVRRVTAIREAVISPSAELDDRSGRLSHFTARARTVVKLAIEQARERSAAEVGTEHLLHGIVAEGGNLALQVLSALEIEPAQITRELERHREAAHPGPSADLADGDPDPGSVAAETVTAAGSGDLRIGAHAAAALELAVTEATSFGHNYVGCEHLLLGLIAEPDGAAGRILRGLGAELRLTRRAVSAAVAGYYIHAQQSKAATATVTDPMTKLAELIDQQLGPVVQRLERVESNLGLGNKGMDGRG